ncbi:MAG TPA: HIT domain-containing protein [Candidatus Saccharimonadales bacterium]|nr:HIT domain-containing protein [Candidatus Saccharimonadales bacterium]
MNEPEESVFTKIVKGEIPCDKVYEDELTLAFMDIHPVTPGHVLVISKKQIDKLWELPDEDYQAVQNTVKKVCKRIEEVLKPDRVGIKVIGIDVPHAHIHVFPFDGMDEYNRVPDMSKEPDHEALAEMAEKLAFS